MCFLLATSASDTPDCKTPSHLLCVSNPVFYHDTDRQGNWVGAVEQKLMASLGARGILATTLQALHSSWPHAMLCTVSWHALVRDAVCSNKASERVLQEENGIDIRTV